MRRSAPRGSGLYWDSRCELWFWRKTDPRTGKRRPRCTDQRRLDLAMRVAATFEDELRQELAGIRTYEEWRTELAPLVRKWVRAQEGDALERTLDDKRKALERAMAALRIKVAADLLDLGALTDRLRALEGTRTSRLALVRSYQRPLKEFSAWLAGNCRFLDRDPLASWELLHVRRRRAQARRCFLPHEVARAHLALDLIDARREPAFRQRTLFVAMLVTAPRATAMAERDVEHFDRADQRIDLGESAANKRRGDGSLDPRTTDEIASFLGERTTGPLFPSRAGARHDCWRLLDTWREAFGLGIVDELWPRDERWEEELALHVLRALLRGRVSVSPGGNPKRVRPETRRAEERLAARVGAIANRLRTDWTERMTCVDDHAHRKTHRTWAELLGGIPAPVIDRQLGHAESGSMSDLRALAGSLTGRRHYLDRSTPLLDSRRSAQAVRDVLDQALEDLAAHGRCRLLEGRRDDRAEMA